MYKQLNIVWFVTFSIVMHIIFFVQYQYQSPSVFNNPESLNVTLSRQIVRLNFLSTDAVQPVEKTVRKLKSNNKVIPDFKSEKVLNNVEQNIAQSSVDELENNDVEAAKQNKKNSNTKDAEQSMQSAQQTKQKGSKENLYLETIITAIEKNKYYPALARRRNMQAVVEVSFNLLETGEVVDIEMTGRYKLLRHAARLAILNALPFSPPPLVMQFPYKVKYLMEFKLKT